MKNITLTIITIIGLIIPNELIGQIELTKENVYSPGEVQIFQAELYENVLTRQNSVSIMLKDFIFPEISEGTYLASLKLSMLQYPINSSKPIVLYEVNSLFDDVIKSVSEEEIIIEGKKEIKKKIKQHIELSLSNKVLGFNFILSEISHIKIEVRLVKIKSEYQEMFNMVKPILNVAMSNQTTVDLVDNILKNLAPDEDKNNLLFYTELTIPSNVFEYKKLKDKGEIPLVENNQEFAIVLNGTTPINDESLGGMAKEIVNKTTKFFAGKKVLDKTTANYSGLVRLYITKDQNPILPTFISNSLKDLDVLINGVDVSDNIDEINALIKNVSKISDYSFKAKEINNQTFFSITQYLKLIRIYVNLLTDDENEKKWIFQFNRWSNLIDTKGSAFGVQAIGITELYEKAKVAKIYIPYSLGDDFLMSMYIWQKDLHKAMALAKNKDLAIPLPKK